MTEITTNREFYRGISALIEGASFASRSLEDYLKALLNLAYGKRALSSFTAAEFFNILAEAGSAVVPPFDDGWRNEEAEDVDNIHGFPRLEATLIRQIIDLRELEETGALDDKFRYFGIKSPRDNPWHNFDVGTFLECATEGFFQGWAPDETVLVLTMDGKLEEHDGKEFDWPIYQIERISWDDFAKFLVLGQIYE